MTGLILWFGGSRCAPALAQNEATPEAFARAVEQTLPPENAYEYHKRLSQGPVHVLRRNADARAQAGELTLPDQGWKLVWNQHGTPVLQGAVRDFQDYLGKSMCVRTELDGRDSLDNIQNLRQCIVVGTREQLPGCGTALKGPKDYEIIVTPERLTVCGYDERGAMFGLYNLEARMNLREAPILPANLKTVRHSLYDVRMVHSWMGWMEFPDPLLAHLAHDGFDAIYASCYANPNGDRTTAENSTEFYARLMYRIRQQDPARMRDLINRASRFGIKVYTPIIYQYVGTPESEAGLRRLVQDTVKQFPDIQGYVLLTEGFWYKQWGGGHGASKEYVQDWARNWSHAVAVVAEECHRVNPAIEILPWEYNIDFRPQNVEMKRYFIQQLPANTIPLLTWENGKAFELDGLKGYLRDYSISQIGPAEVTAAQIAEARQRGMKVYCNADTFLCGAQLQTVPYHPFPYQWHDRHQAMEKYGVNGTMESWSSGYTPNFMTELRAWACWTDSPPFEELLAAIGAREFGDGGKQKVLKAWDLFSQAIRLVPDTGPTMGTSSAIGNPLFFQEPPPRTATFNHSWADHDKWTGYLGGELNPYWPFTVGRLVFYPDFTNGTNKAETYARAVSGIDATQEQRVLPVFLKHLQLAADRMEDGLAMYRAAALASPAAKRAGALREVVVAEQINRMLQSNHAVLEFEDLRLQFVAEQDREKAETILRRMETIVREEIARTELSLLAATRDSRLGFQSECDYVYTPYSLREKLASLRETLEKLAERRKNNGCQTAIRNSVGMNMVLGNDGEKMNVVKINRCLFSSTRALIATGSILMIGVAIRTTALGQTSDAAPAAATTEVFARAVEQLPQENLYDYHKRLTDGPVHFQRRDPEAHSQAGELVIPDHGWKLVWNQQSKPVLQGAVRDFQDYLNTSMGVRVDLDGRDSLEKTQDLRQCIVVGTREQLPGCGATLKGPKDYEILVTPERLTVCGYDERGAMFGLYNLEARMNLREAPILPADLKTVRHSLYDARMVQSWMGWMEFPDPLLAHLAHDGFDAIFASAYANPNGDYTTAETSTDFYSRLLFQVRRQDPARMRDLVNRASRFGIKVYAPIIHRSMGTPESEAELRRLVQDIVKQFPDIQGYVLLTEGFWYKQWGGGHGASKEYVQDWARNWSRAVAVVAEECHRVNPAIEILPWEYNIDFRPQNVEMKQYFIQQLPADTIPLLTWENGKGFELDGMKGYLRDYSLNQIGPAEVTAGQIAEARNRGMKVFSKADTFASWQFGTIPYLPCPCQWGERYKALEKYGVNGTMESWSSAYTPNFMTALRAWTCWTDAPPFDELLAAVAARDFGAGEKEKVLKAWDHFSQAIRLVPDTGPNMGTNNAVGNPLFFQEPPLRTATFTHSWMDHEKWMGYMGSQLNPYWPFTVSRMVFYPDFTNRTNLAEQYARAATGVEVDPQTKILPVFLKTMRQASDQMEDGLKLYRDAALESPKSKRPGAVREVVVAEHLQRMMQSDCAVLQFEDLRMQLAAEKDREKANALLDRLETIAREEIARTELSLLAATRDSRLGFQQEQDYVYTPYSLREKLKNLHDTLDKQLPEYRKKNAIP